jgi:hypothetical protein
MNTRNRLLLCALFISVTMIASCTCPTGDYADNGSTFHFQLTTTSAGIVSGLMALPDPCDSDYAVSGTSDGINIHFMAELQEPNPNCPCYDNPLEFTLTAKNLCSVFDGSISGCLFPKPLSITLVKSTP